MSEHPSNPTQPTPITLNLAELEDILQRAAERGSQCCLAKLGLENGSAARDIRQLRDLLEVWREARRAVWQTVIKVITTGLLAALLVGIAMKVKLIGGIK